MKDCPVGHVSSFQLQTRNSTPCRVGKLVGWYTTNFFELQTTFELRLLPNNLQQSCHVSGLVYLSHSMQYETEKDRVTYDHSCIIRCNKAPIKLAVSNGWSVVWLVDWQRIQLMIHMSHPTRPCVCSFKSSISRVTEIHSNIIMLMRFSYHFDFFCWRNGTKSSLHIAACVLTCYGCLFYLVRGYLVMSYGH